MSFTLPMSRRLSRRKLQICQHVWVDGIGENIRLVSVNCANNCQMKHPRRYADLRLTTCNTEFAESEQELQRW